MCAAAGPVAMGPDVAGGAARDRDRPGAALVDVQKITGRDIGGAQRSLWQRQNLVVAGVSVVGRASVGHERVRISSGHEAFALGADVLPVRQARVADQAGLPGRRDRVDVAGQFVGRDQVTRISPKR
jgi:hypothetical protein